MDIPSEVLKLVIEQGLTAPVIALLFLGLYIYERKGRAADRERHEVALRQAAAETVETLKTVIPLVHKMTATLDVALPVLLAKIGSDGK